MLIKHEIARLVADAVARALEEGDLPPLALPEVTVEHPAREEHGDYAASLPMKLARAARSDPLAVAEAITKHIIQAKLELEVVGRRLSPERILTFAPSYNGLVRRRLRAQWGKWINW